MDFSRIAKSPAAIAFSDNPDSGLKLVHYRHGNALHLDAHQAALWNTWDNGDDEKVARQTIRELLVNNFAVQGEHGQSLEAFESDTIVPKVAGVNIKWYAESLDLNILFNTTPMRINNPLLVLGPYGSLIWRGIIDGLSIGQLRHHTNSVFGKDETIGFIKRLSSLGFIQKIDTIEPVDPQPETMIKEFPAPFIQHKIKMASVPWYCLWEICSTCNMACKTCYLPHLPGRNPSTEASTQIADKIIDAGVFHVTILGGEPLTRADLEDVVHKFRKAGVFVKVLSNGKELSVKRADTLNRAGLNQIEFSLDGLSPATHESSRGEGSFNAVLQAISHSQKAHIPRIGIVFTVYSENSHEISQLPSFMKKTAIKECYISIFRKLEDCGNGAHFTPIQGAQFKNIRKEIDHIARQNHDLSITILSECTCGKTSLVIGEHGDVRPCPFRHASAGNVCDEPLIDIWETIIRRIETDTAIPSPEYCQLTIYE